MNNRFQISEPTPPLNGMIWDKRNFELTWNCVPDEIIPSKEMFLGLNGIPNLTDYFSENENYIVFDREVCSYKNSGLISYAVLENGVFKIEHYKDPYFKVPCMRRFDCNEKCISDLDKLKGEVHHDFARKDKCDYKEAPPLDLDLKLRLCCKQ
jgi:hypothetical protein